MFGFGKKKRDVLVPFAGEVIDITAVSDPVFSAKMVGDGFAVIPAGGVVEACAPISGELVQVFHTGHAFALKGDDGFEVLVHLGIDTVELKGEGFEVLAEAGTYVEAGTPIVRVNTDVVAAHGRATVTPVVFTKKKMVAKVSVLEGSAERGDKGAVVTLA